MNRDCHPTFVASWQKKILPLRAQAQLTDGWLLERLETVLPAVMQRANLDMWLVIGREYNEDPVMGSLLPATMLSARRLTMLLFALTKEGKLERLTISRYGLAPFYQAAWNPDAEDQWQCLARLVRERNPKRIGINCSETFAFGDGLTHSLYQNLVAALDEEMRPRLENAEEVAVGWLEKRTPAEIAAYSGIAALAHGLIAEAFSRRIIHPGVTTPADVVWWFRQQTNALGLTCWFHPSVSIQRQGVSQSELGPDTVIQPGDLLHCDFGLHYLQLATDTQQNAYVLRLGETKAPAGLRAALCTGNRLQDILADQMVAGRSGNEILLAALEQAKNEGIKASIYTHPLGYHGHAAGPTIGLWDAQGGVPGRGDYPLYTDTCHSMELNIKRTVPEWGDQEVTMALEQDVVVCDNRVYFLDSRQTALHLI